MGTVREAAAGRWMEILTRCGLNGALLVNRHGPCPGCGGRDRFRFDDQGSNGTFICSRGGGGVIAGDGFKLLEHALGWDWRRAQAEVAGILGIAAGAMTYREKSRDGVMPEPVAAAKPELGLDPEQVAALLVGVPAVSADWLRRRSPIDPRGLAPADFLETLYEPGERVMVFIDQRSQGDFLWEIKKEELRSKKGGGYRLSQQRGVRAVRSALPAGGPEGVWFLTQPVSGLWMINPRTDPAKWTRRSECNVAAWRYFVLESDELPMAEWLRVLVSLPLPVAAIYTSGKRSVHALVRWPVGSKGEWDVARDMIRRVVCPLGADPAALTAVRLSRLPGCKRGVNAQELLYLAPEPGHDPIRLLREVRG